MTAIDCETVRMVRLIEKVASDGWIVSAARLTAIS